MPDSAVPGPQLVIMAGLPGTGKSTLARALAERFDGAVIDKDLIRAALFAPADVEYSASQDDFVMELMLETAAFLIERRPQRVVFLDGRTFSREYQRCRALQFASTLGIPSKIVECICSPAIARERLAADERSGAHPAANRTWELYERVRDSFEPVAGPKIVVDTGEPLVACVARALRGLSA